ncbi:MAG: AAA family ATPase [Blastocatellia bacterium]
MAEQNDTGALPEWMIYRGVTEPDEPSAPDIAFPEAPPWRAFTNKAARGQTYRPTFEQIRMVNAALYLRRPLLITGKPGVGKSSLAYAVARELGLGPVLRWSITSRSTLAEGLYRYDAIGRMQAVQINPKEVPDIGQYLTLGPLGTAMLPAGKPRMLLIDEIDKSDIDLPNDLLNIFEEGEFDIPELARIPADQQPVAVRLYDGKEKREIDNGRVNCTTFPFVIMTSNGERDFPAPFLRRCLRLRIDPPKADELARIVEAHLADYLDARVRAADAGNRETIDKQVRALIADFVTRRDERNETMANDQLLNAVFMLTRDLGANTADVNTLKEALLRPLSSGDGQ